MKHNSKCVASLAAAAEVVVEQACLGISPYLSMHFTGTVSVSALQRQLSWSSRTACLVQLQEASADSHATAFALSLSLITWLSVNAYTSHQSGANNLLLLDNRRQRYLTRQCCVPHWAC